MKKRPRRVCVRKITKKQQVAKLWKFVQGIIRNKEVQLVGFITGPELLSEYFSGKLD